MEPRKAALIAAVCGVAVLIGVLLPWYSMSFDFPGGERVGIGAGVSQSLNGTQGDFKGGFVLVLGLLGGVAAALLSRGTTGGLPLSTRGLALIAVGAFGLGALLTLTDLFTDVPTLSGTHVSAGRGIGIYLTLLASAAGAFLSFLCLRGTPAGAAS